ncbi:hypothetical protein MHYP_G00135610 [Metynnis hypsauchen]
MKRLLKQNTRSCYHRPSRGGLHFSGFELHHQSKTKYSLWTEKDFISVDRDG